MEPLTEILVLVLLLAANGVFALSEIAVVSARKARLQQDADQGRPGAESALKLAEDPNDFLSTVQIGISLIGVLAGAFGGATIAEEMTAFLGRFPLLDPYSEWISFGIVVLVITYFSLVIGELVPKRLALRNPERFAAAVAGPMQKLTEVFAPAVRVLSASTDLVLRIIGAQPSEALPVTEEEIRVMIDQGRRAGVFAQAEQDMIEAVLRLDDQRAGVVMTPRSKVVNFQLGDSNETILKKLADNRFAQYPLVDGDLDTVVGMVHTKDLLVMKLARGDIDLTEIAKKPLYVLETLPVLNLLATFKEEGVHNALVLDEYGVIQGIVTHNDILEGVVGFAPTRGADQSPELVKRPDGSYLADGLMPIDMLWKRLGIFQPPEDLRGGYQTLGGFVTTRMGRIPSTGETFEWGGFTFEVVDMDLNRVDKILITAVIPESPDS